MRLRYWDIRCLGEVRYKAVKVQMAARQLMVARTRMAVRQSMEVKAQMAGQLQMVVKVQMVALLQMGVKDLMVERHLRPVTVQIQVIQKVKHLGCTRPLIRD